MANIGYGYGSECHLLRWMGRHRDKLNAEVAKKVGTDKTLINWLDFKFASDGSKRWPDKELEGLEFLREDEYARIKGRWQEFWPQGKGIMNWDAVARIGPENKEYLLVEAKAHIEEMKSCCENKIAKALWEKAEKRIENLNLPFINDFLKQGDYSNRAKDNLGKICNAFNNLKRLLKVQRQETYGDKCDLSEKIFYTKEWLYGFYQTANRLAVLDFLNNNTHGIATRLLFIYFYGDKLPADKNRPQNKREWESAILKQNDYLGIPDKHHLIQKIDKLFLPVWEGRSDSGESS